MKEKLSSLVLETFEELNEVRDEKIPTDNVFGISLYGEDGIFDSMHLVSFLALLEEKLEDELDIEISLTSEKAVSRRVSPFAGVANLVAFIEEEIRELGVELSAEVGA